MIDNDVDDVVIKSEKVRTQSTCSCCRRRVSRVNEYGECPLCSRDSKCSICHKIIYVAYEVEGKLVCDGCHKKLINK